MTTTTPTESLNAEVKGQLREQALDSFYFFCVAILGYEDMTFDYHLPVCEFLRQTQALHTGSRRMVLLPRSTFKSTIATISYPIWRLCHEPDLRILIISDTQQNASRFMSEIQNHFERNETFRSVFSEMIPPNFNVTVWNQSEMLVANRTKIWREPSIDAIGLGGGVESRHYDLIIADDTITEKAIHSDLEMEKAINWTGGLESLLVKPNDEILWIGSRKKRGDLYETVQTKFGGDADPIDIGPHTVQKGELLLYSRSAIEDGVSVFPERIPMGFLKRLSETDPERYNAQYVNHPLASGLNFFPPETIQFFEWNDHGQIVRPAEKAEEGDVLISPYSMERLVLYDPSKAEKDTSSKQAILVVAKGDGPHRYIFSADVAHYPPDEAIEKLFTLYGEWAPSIYAIEDRGFQGSIKYWLEEKTEREGLPSLPVIEWPFPGSPNAQWSKIERIRGLIPLFRARYVWLAPELRNSELHEQLLYYPQTRWDDGVDALAMSLDFWPWIAGAEAEGARRTAEEQFLLEKIGRLPRTEAWDEQEFLSQLNATGYGLRLRGEA